MASNKDNVGGGSLSLASDQEVEITTEAPPSSMPESEQITRSRAIGGFIADDLEEGKEIPVTHIAPDAVPYLPMATTQDVARSIQHAPAVPLIPAVKLTPATVLAVPVSAHSVTAPKARLPYDTTGLLEDRIKEDSRGDLEAWLSLISGHKRLNKLGEARVVYERFFRIFPTAVSLLPICTAHH